MHSSIITKCLDKNVQAILRHLSHQSYTLGSTSCLKKRRSPFLTLKNNFTYILDSILEKQIAFGASNEFQNFIKEHAVGSKPAVKTIMKVLQVDEEYARNIVTDNKNFTYITCKNITDNYRILKTAGMSLSNLQNNPEFLSEHSNVLQRKVTHVQKLVDDINCGIPLFFHSENSLDQFINSISKIPHDNPVRNKVKFYKEQWNVDNKELCKLLSKYLYYLINHPQKTESLIKLLLDNKVNIESLLNKKWYITDLEKTKKRLEICTKFGFLSSIDPWILKCDDTEFNRKIKIQDNKCEDIKEYTQLVQYLSQSSGYTTNLIRYRISIHCTLAHPNFKKIKAISDIIMKEGYEWHDLIWYVKVFSISEELIIERFSVLKRINHKTPFLDFLLMSNQNFIIYVNKCKKKNSLIS